MSLTCDITVQSSSSASSVDLSTSPLGSSSGFAWSAAPSFNSVVNLQFKDTVPFGHYVVFHGTEMLMPRFPDGALIPAPKINHTNLDGFARDHVSAFVNCFYVGAGNTFFGQPLSSSFNSDPTSSSSTSRPKIVTRRDRQLPNCTSQMFVVDQSRRKCAKGSKARKASSLHRNYGGDDVPYRPKMGLKKGKTTRYKPKRREPIDSDSGSDPDKIADVPWRRARPGTRKILKHTRLGHTVHYQVQQASGLVQWLEEADVDDSLIRAYNSSLPDDSSQS